MNVQPWKSKKALKEFLQNLKEYGQLDVLLIEYIRERYGHKIVREPQKGKEDGKDIVAVENEGTGEYCVYIVKRGNLTSSTLKGKCGVLNQMEEAFFIELEEPEYQNKKRTAIIVYNGPKPITREANKKFYSKKKEVEKEMGDLLLRPIEIWGLDFITDEFFSLGDKICANEKAKLWSEKKSRHYELNIKNVEEAKTLIANNASRDELEAYIQKHTKSIEEIEGEYRL